jgi:multidrug resistance efflux pump
MVGPVMAAEEPSSNEPASADASVNGDAPMPMDSEALDALNRMAGTLAQAQGFSVTIRAGYDIVQDTGQKITFGERRRFTLSRPDRLRIEVEESDGRVIEVGVVDNAIVAADQVLFRIDPEPYIIAVREAEAGLARIGQTIGASTAAVDSAQARLVEVTANRSNIRDQAQRAMELVKRGVYARAKEDEAKASLQAADATVTRAEADLAKARQELGPAGENNPDLQAALAALERARLNLARTTVSAPSAGVVTNLQLAIGEAVATGEAVMTFIDAGTIWIAAAFKENSLQFVNPGDQAQIVLDSLPGQVFPAHVESVGWGVSGNSVDPATGLPTIRNQSGWVREPQRFPVRLIFDGRYPVGVRFGSQANVVIYTGESNPVMNALGGLWIRIVSVLTYVS